MIHAKELMLVGGIVWFLLTIYWVRSRQMREKYAIFWLALAVILLTVGIFPQLILGTAEALNLSYGVVFSAAVSVVLFVYSFSVSVSLSRNHRRVLTLTQELAILEERLRKLEEPNEAS